MKLWIAVVLFLVTLFGAATVVAIVEVFWLEPRKEQREEMRRQAMKGMKQIYP